MSGSAYSRNRPRSCSKQDRKRSAVPRSQLHSLMLLDHRRVKDGDLVLLSGFGAGMTWASAIIRWGDLHR